MHIFHRLHPIPAVIDLNAILYNRRSFPLQEATDEYTADRLRPDHGLPAASRISKMRSAIQGGLQGQELFLFRSVSFFGLCPADLSRKSPRKRVLSSNDEEPSLSYGLSKADLSEHVGPRQRDSRLAHLCRLRSDLHHPSPDSLRRRRSGTGTEELRPCLRFNHDRCLFVAFSMGSFPPTQRRGQAPFFQNDSVASGSTIGTTIAT